VCRKPEREKYGKRGNGRKPSQTTTGTEGNVKGKIGKGEK